MKLINSALTILLSIFSIYIGVSLYKVDKVSFICPVDYGNKPVVIRTDLAGDGNFGAGRNGKRKHKGVDILAEVGEPIYAPLSGLVVTAEFDRRGYGNYVVIEHSSENLTTLYAHLSKICVKENKFVRQGEIIGFVGKTGNACGKNVLAHLHFEMYKDNKLIDPVSYLE